MNCCLLDIETVLTGGFEMGNIWYNEPKTADTAYDVIGDIVLSAASQQYGGFTLPEIDKVLDKYAQKSYDMTLTAYNHGSRDLLTLQNAADALMRAKTDREYLLYSLISAVLDLENTLGIPFGSLGKEE